MSEETRTRIIEAGSQIIHLHGFQGTGLKAILDAAEVPKGSFYHYFKSKEDFGLAVIKHYAGFTKSIVEPIIEDTTHSTLERFRAIFHAFRALSEENDCTRGCLLANLSQEMADLSEPMRKLLDEVFNRASAAFAILIREGQQSGEINPDFDANDAADFVFASWHGAMIRMKLHNSLAPLDLFERMIISHFLSA